MKAPQRSSHELDLCLGWPKHLEVFPAGQFNLNSKPVRPSAISGAFVIMAICRHDRAHLVPGIRAE